MTERVPESSSTHHGGPRVTWVTKSFLDYRVPVFQELDRLCGHNLHILFGDRLTPERVRNKMTAILGDRAMALSGERVLGANDDSAALANRTFRIPFQPGLLRAIRLTRPDVLVGDGFFQWTAAALAHRMLHGTPLVVCYERTFHTERHAQKGRLWYRRLSLRWVDAVCCNGRLCREYTEWLGVPSSRINTGHMAADVEGLARRAEAVQPAEIRDIRSQWQARGLVFLYIGQLIERKGLGQLLSAWSQLQRMAGPESATLIIAGNGSAHEEEHYRRMAADLRLTRVLFAGRVDHDRIASWYASADVLVMPTLEDNWSLVVPEAMACGLPILTSVYNGCWPELVQEGVNGWVFDALAPEDILRCLLICLARRGSLPAMGAASREIVRQHSPAHAARAVYDAIRIGARRCSRSSRFAMADEPSLPPFAKEGYP